MESKQTSGEIPTNFEKISPEDLTDLKQQLEKKRDAYDYAAILSVLKLLQKKQINLELLKTTQIGKTLSALSKIESKSSESENEAHQVR